MHNSSGIVVLISLCLRDSDDEIMYHHAGLIPDLVRGPEAIKIAVAFYRTAFPDLHITIDALTAHRDAVLLRWTARNSTGQGTLTGLLVSRVANGHIAESWMQWDQAGALARIGLDRTNPPGAAPAPLD